ncbi:unnamed protein product [Schistosoma mattheei]|uniref:Uncharacterized protein n=1 Tax=Schistosoma mattheei TaxID=31246 RepID=A0A183PJL5_9TREM|nr:unnamed protein product [Schistosoma mattheei]
MHNKLYRRITAFKPTLYDWKTRHSRRLSFGQLSTEKLVSDHHSDSELTDVVQLLPHITSRNINQNGHLMSDPLPRNYQQQRTVGENKPDPSGRRNQEEELEVDRTFIEESTRLHHKASPQSESSRPKEKRKTKEHITSRNGDRHEKNGQRLDRSGEEGPGQSCLENAGRRPILHWE